MSSVVAVFHLKITPVSVSISRLPDGEVQCGPECFYSTSLQAEEQGLFSGTLRHCKDNRHHGEMMGVHLNS